MIDFFAASGIDYENYGAEDMKELDENELEETKGEPVVSGQKDFSSFEKILKNQPSKTQIAKEPFK